MLFGCKQFSPLCLLPSLPCCLPPPWQPTLGACSCCSCRTRNQKRKVDDDHSDEEGEGHEDFDPQQLREHEEFTKVRGRGKVGRQAMGRQRGALASRTGRAGGSGKARKEGEVVVGSTSRGAWQAGRQGGSK